MKDINNKELSDKDTSLNNKLKELNEDELEKVTGGSDMYCMYRSECKKGQDCKLPEFYGSAFCLPW